MLCKIDRMISYTEELSERGEIAFGWTPNTELATFQLISMIQDLKFQDPIT
jgi:hypothetical protein